MPLLACGPLLIALLASLNAPSAQSPQPVLTGVAQRAQQHDRQGWKLVETRDFDGAVREFGAALQLNPDYADALHGLGKAQVELKHYDAAVQAFERCRTVYERSGSDEAEHRTAADHAREDRLRELRRRVFELENLPQSQGTQTTRPEVIDLREQIRQLEGDRQPGPLVEGAGPVPAFLSLALGSAYFHVNRVQDAERMFRAAIAAQPKFGEAHSNLALVCLLTGRPEEAQQHVTVAEEAGFTIAPELKRRIRDALKSKRS